MTPEKTKVKKVQVADGGCLYTFIMGFKGGTYISQVHAENEKVACREWAEALEVDEIKGFGIKTHQALFAELEDEEPTPIATTKNVWIITLLLLGHFSMVHIIKTDESGER